MYCKDLGFEGKVVLQYWLLGVRLCHNTVHCIVTEARQGLYCNTVTVPTIQQGHGRWASAGGRAGARIAGGRAAGRVADVGVRGRRQRARGWADGHWADWAQARGAWIAGAGSVRGIGRQGARLGVPGVLAGPVGGSCTRLDFQTGFSTRYFS